MDDRIKIVLDLQAQTAGAAAAEQALQRVGKAAKDAGDAAVQAVQREAQAVQSLGTGSGSGGAVAMRPGPASVPGRTPQATATAPAFGGAFDVSAGNTSAGGGGAGRGRSGGGSFNGPLALLEFSRAAEDAQYGIRGVVNNIPGLVMMLGGGAGVAGVASLAAVAVSMFADKLEILSGKLAEEVKAEQDASRARLNARHEAEAGRKAQEARTEAQKAFNDELEREVTLLERLVTARQNAYGAGREFSQAELERDLAKIDASSSPEGEKAARRRDAKLAAFDRETKREENAIRDDYAALQQRREAIEKRVEEANLRVANAPSEELIRARRREGFIGTADRYQKERESAEAELAAAVKARAEEEKRQAADSAALRQRENRQYLRPIQRETLSIQTAAEVEAARRSDEEKAKENDQKAKDEQEKERREKARQDREEINRRQKEGQSRSEAIAEFAGLPAEAGTALNQSIQQLTRQARGSSTSGDTTKALGDIERAAQELQGGATSGELGALALAMQELSRVARFREAEFVRAFASLREEVEKQARETRQRMNELERNTAGGASFQ